jgi:hypothetical protein
MELEAKIVRARELIAQRDAINEELEQLLTGSIKKPLRCGACQEEGHTARTCPRKAPAG